VLLILEEDDADIVVDDLVEEPDEVVEEIALVLLLDAIVEVGVTVTIAITEDQLLEEETLVMVVVGVIVTMAATDEVELLDR